MVQNQDDLKEKGGKSEVFVPLCLMEFFTLTSTHPIAQLESIPLLKSPPFKNAFFSFFLFSYQHSFSPSPSHLLHSTMDTSHLESHYGETPISAVIIDLDGTLLNTEQATKDVLKELLAKYGKVVDMEKENKRLGMVHKDAAIAIVKDYQLPMTAEQYSHEIMPMYKEKWLQAKALPGANRLIKHLHKNGVPFSLASNSLRKNIEVKISHQQGWKECFSAILGSDQVKSGKPSPDIFLEAANKMGVDAAACLVIEDSQIGVKAGKAAGMKVVAVPSIQSESDKYSIADSVLHSLLEFRPEMWGLPPFDDWVDNALPIDPICLKGLYKNGTLHEFSGNGASSLADQVSGIYFGWAKVDSNMISKVVMSIKWQHSCCTSKRKIEACLVDRINEDIGDQQMQLLLVGYIRGLCSKGNTCKNVEITEEDKLIATASLDLPAFAHHTRIPFFAEVAYEDDSSL